jgi:iron complex outermembrane recepter protein
MNAFFWRKSLLLSVAATMAVPAAGAPVQPAGERLMLEEVVVTARRRAETLQEVPIAVTAFSGDALALRGARDITELAEIVPSVTIEPSRATNSTLTAFIRGVGQQDPLAGFEQGVALYIDDVYVGRPQGALLDIYDVERIEVLRGPQGTLYGRNAVGGAIKYVTRRLSDEREFRLRGSYGSHDQIDLVGTASLPLADWVRVGATVASLTRDGYGRNRTTGDDQYEKDLFAWRASVELEPHDALLVRLAYDRTDDDSNPVAGYRPYPGALSGAPVLGNVRDTLAGAAQQPSTAGIGGENKVESEGFNVSIDWQVSDAWEVRSITAWREDDSKSLIDFDSLAVMDFDGAGVYENEQFSQELQVLYMADRLKAVIGAYYLDAKASNDFDVVLGQFLGGLGITALTRGTVDTEAWSVFADATYDLTDRLALSLGGRYTEDKRSADIFRATYLGIGSPFFGNQSALLVAVTGDFEASRTFYDFSPRVNLSYALTDDVNVYAGFSQGFKAGSYDPRGANFETPEVTKGYKPETLDSWEAGIKATWLDGRVRTNVAVFYSEYKDMQIPGSFAYDSDGDGVNDSFAGAVTNAGKAEIRGIEFEGEFLVTERLGVQASLSLLDPKIKKWILDDVDVSGERKIQNTPETMAYLGAVYRVDLGGGTLNLNANWSYKSKIYQFEVPLPDIDQSAYQLVNASIVWLAPGENWSVGLHGKNLGDKDVKTAGYCFGFTGCPSSLGFENNTTIFYGPPRTWTATAEYRF